MLDKAPETAVGENANDANGKYFYTENEFRDNFFVSNVVLRSTEIPSKNLRTIN